MKKSHIIIQLAVVAAILVVANLVSNSLYFRLDFTEDQRYTLSKATKNILEELDNVVTVTAYFSEELPPQLIQNRKDFEDMLVEYENRSGGNVVYQFDNPNEDQTKEQETQQKGIMPLSINVRENDRVETMRAYMGAVLQMGDRSEVLPVIQPGASMEYDLTTAIKKLSIVDKPKVAFIQGHGELGLANVPQLEQQLSVLYEVEDYGLSDEEIPSYYRALAWVAPRDTIPEIHLRKIENYLASGGALLVAYTNLTGDLQQGRLSPAPKIGLVEWLKTQGVIVGSDFVTDAQSANVSVQQQQGFFTMRRQIQFPYFPQVSNFNDHPAVKGLDQLTLNFATTIAGAPADSSVRSTTLMYTSEMSGIERAPTFLDLERRWTENDFGMGPQPLAVALEGLGNGLGKLIVIGNGDFFSNGDPQQPRQVQPDHVNFASNAIDWLADDTGLIDLRTKGITSRPLEQIEDSTKNVYKYGNVFAPIIILLIYGSIRRIQNQRKVQKWREGNYD